MSTAVQRRRGTTAQHASFAGLNGELTVDTDKEVVVVHDGTTAGGYPQMRESGSQNLVTTGSITGARLIPTGSTVPTNGIYLPSANTVGVATNGSGRLFVDANGNVGLGGTNSLGYGSSGPTLQVIPTGTPFGAVTVKTGCGYGFGNVNTSIVGEDTTGGNYLAFRVNNNEHVRITSAGRLGVGVSSPQLSIGAVSGNVLHVAGAGTTGVRVQNTSGNSVEFFAGTDGFINASGSAGLNLQTGGTTRATLTSTGLGIGTTSPQSPLSIYGDSDNVVSAYVENNNAPGPGSVNRRLMLAHGSTTAHSIAVWQNAGIIESTGSGGGLALGAYSDALTDPIKFYTGNRTERARIDGSGRLLVGTSTARTNFFNTTQSANIQLEGTSGTALMSLVSNADASGGNPALILGKTRGTSVGATTIVQSGDTIGRITFQGSDGTEFVQAADITAEVDGTPGANDMPGRLVFSTTADGASSPTERMRIRADGAILAGSGGDGIWHGSVFSRLTGNVNRGFIIVNTGSGIGPLPCEANGTTTDNNTIFGFSSSRWSVIYAATGTINTSDVNEKQDIQDLSAAELAVAQELKTLLKTFRWKEAVQQKGDDARIHVGVMAQDVETAFQKHGLDATRYALWCKDTWYEVEGKSTTDDGSFYTAESAGAVEKTRLGVRYDQLLAFVLAAL